MDEGKIKAALTWVPALLLAGGFSVTLPAAGTGARLALGAAAGAAGVLCASGAMGALRRWRGRRRADGGAILCSTLYDRELRDAVRHPDHVSLVCDRGGMIVQWDAHAERLFGWRGDQMLGKRLDTLLPPGPAAEAFDAVLARALAARDNHDGPSIEFDTAARHRDGHLLQVRVTLGAAGARNSGELLAVVRLDARRARQPARSPGRLALDDNMPALMAYIDLHQRYRFCNLRQQDIVGIDPSRVVGRTVREVFGDATYRLFAAELQMALQGRAVTFERVLRIRNRRIDSLIEFVPDLGADGSVAGVYTVVLDITRRKRAESRLVAEKEWLRVTLGSIADAVITLDTEGRVSYLNPVAETLTGWRSDEAIGVASGSVFNVVDKHSGQAVPSPVPPLFATPWMGAGSDLMLIHRGGRCCAIEGSLAPIRDRAGAILGGVLVFRDVSAGRTMLAELTYQASHDALTGLVNRREFECRVDAALAAVRADSTSYSVLYLDLDQFKIVNDSCGHAAGDQLLRQLAMLLRAVLRPEDTLARLGGDEFGVLLCGCGESSALRVADQLRQTVQEFSFGWEGKVFPIGVSIGLISIDDVSLQLADVLRMADAACYMAKEKGRNRVWVYRHDDEELMRRQGEMDWTGRIHAALAENRLELYAQRIRALRPEEGDGEHYEVLLRLRAEDGALVPPMAFIPSAERYGLMPQLDRWVIEHALRALAVRCPAGAPVNELCAINLSGTSVGDPAMLAYICQQFAVSGVAPAAVCFEITETAAIANLAQARTLIGQLSAMGCRFALDDFGSGLSSFGYLKHLPVHFLKIDGGFVKNMLSDAIDHAMVAAINQIGHVMGIQTIAEFVETEALSGALAALGVDFVQGYGVQAPLPLAAFEALRFA